MKRRFLTAAVLAILASAPAAANDSVAEIGAGGLVLGRSGAIEMASETLYLSMDRVEVDYVFRNRSNENVETVVAFPMPDINVDPYDGDWAIPRREDNFLGFSVDVDGRSVEPELQQRAWAAGIDVTEAVREAGLPVAPFDLPDGRIDTSGRSEAEIEALMARGIVQAWRDSETGRYEEVYPAWTLKSAYWWRMTFPAGATVRVHHGYTPATGGSAGLFFLMGDHPGGVDPAYVDKYCLDASFLAGLRRRQAEAEAAGSYGYTESRLSYVLTTGANWAGPIGHLRVIVDKGAPDNLVSFCGEGVTKTGPTTFEMEMEDFWPERDLDILFAVAPQQ